MKNKLLLIIFLSLSGLKIVAQIGGYGEPVKLGSNVNTNAEEGMPLITLDKSTFYFTRTNDSTSNYGYYDQNIWFSSICAIDGGAIDLFCCVCVRKFR